MPNKYYINDVTTPTIDLRSQIQKELRSLERKCNIRVANKETRFSDLKDNKNFYEHVEEEYEGALLLVFQKMKIKNYKEYKLLLGMFYHDFCLINNNEENDFYNEEKQIFEEFKSSVKKYKRSFKSNRNCSFIYLRLYIIIWRVSENVIF